MDSILFAMIDREVEINCSSSLGFRGTIQSVDGGVLKLKDDGGKIYYISVAKISAVCEITESHLRPGFIA